MRVVVEPLHELLEVLVDPGVVGDVVDPLVHLGERRQLAVEHQVGDLEVVGAVRQLLDGVAAIAQDAAVAVDLGDAADRRRGVHEGRIVGEEPEVVRSRADLAEVHGPNGAVGDGQLVRLARAVVGKGHGVGWHGGFLLAASAGGALELVVNESQQRGGDKGLGEKRRGARGKCRIPGGPRCERRDDDDRDPRSACVALPGRCRARRRRAAAGRR